MKFSFYQAFSGGDSAEVEVEVEVAKAVEAVKGGEIESEAVVEAEVGFDECRDDKSERMDEEEIFVADDESTNEDEEELLKDAQRNVAEEAAAQKLLDTGVDRESTVEDEGHDGKQDMEMYDVTNVSSYDSSAENYASRAEEERVEEEEQGFDEEEIIERNDVEAVFDASNFPIESVASNESVNSNSSIHSTASDVSNKLEAIMLDRIAAIDQIRNLLETELENGKIICMFFFNVTSKVI